MRKKEKREGNQWKREENKKEDRKESGEREREREREREYILTKVLKITIFIRFWATMDCHR